LNNKTFTATKGCFKGSDIPNALGHLKYKIDNKKIDLKI